jgi:hypothetical protein
MNMTTATAATSLKDWVTLFFLYGPFFITLFIMIYGIRQAKGAVDKAEQIKPRDQDALRLYRRIYVSVWGFSAVLVVACCTWWFTNEIHESNKRYVLRMDISDAQPTDRFEPASDGVFVRTQNANDPDLRRDEFVVVQEKPFADSDEIEIVHKKGADVVQAIKYPIRVSDLDPRKGSAFKLVFVTETGQYQLVPKHSQAVATNATVTGLLGIGLAYAEAEHAIVGKQINLRSLNPGKGSPPKSPLAPSSPNAQTASPVSIQDFWDEQLGQKRQSIGRQIDALDALEGLLSKDHASVDLLRPIANSETKGETLLSLLLNLSRHQDKLLAYRAQRLLDKANYFPTVSKVATATSGLPPEEQRQILIALNPTQWGSVAADVAAQQKATFSKQQSTYAKTPTPVPSATYDGTKYFTLVTWPALNENQAGCLAEKIYRHNLDAVSLADEQANIAKGNSMGFKFDSRAEATMFAESVKPCGAKTDFVYNGDKRLATVGR